MNPENHPAGGVPQPEQIRRAVEIYLRCAYGGPPPASLAGLLPPDGPFDPRQWLGGPDVERDPPDAPVEKMRTAAFRLGNQIYPHMKLRLSRPPNEDVLLFSVDSHDAILQADPESADFQALEELKSENAKIASAIGAEWETASIPTERSWLRNKILEAKKNKDPQG